MLTGRVSLWMECSVSCLHLVHVEDFVLVHSLLSVEEPQAAEARAAGACVLTLTTAARPQTLWW